MQPIEELIMSAPSDMRYDERRFLYSFIRANKPKRVLEIGAFKGGSAMLIARALHDNGVGHALGIDPYPQSDFAQLPLYGRYELLTGFSPQMIPDAFQKIGGFFDLVIVDGMHTFDAAGADIDGVIPYLDRRSYILVHDAYHYGVQKAVEKKLKETVSLVDCGIVCSTASVETDAPVDPWIAYCGIQMLFYTSRKEPIEEVLTRLFDGRPGLNTGFSEKMVNHNEWTCLAEPCERCRETTASLISSHQTLISPPLSSDVWLVENGEKRLAGNAAYSDATPVPTAVFNAIPTVN